MIGVRGASLSDGRSRVATDALRTVFKYVCVHRCRKALDMRQAPLRECNGAAVAKQGGREIAPRCVRARTDGRRRGLFVSLVS